MNPLLLLGSLTAARRSASEAMHRTARGFVAYAILVCSGLVAVGFFTAGVFLYMTSMWGPVMASMIVAATYAILGSICFLALRMSGRTHPSTQLQQSPSVSPSIEAATAASRDLPGGVIAVALLAAAGYFAGRSMTKRR